MGRGFQYPIPTYNITKDFDWDSPNARLLFEMTAKYGTPYFQNFINSDLDPGDVRSMCCRLQLDKRELRKRGGGLFGSDELTGSIGVVTINLPRIGYLRRTAEQPTSTRGSTASWTSPRESLEIKRKVITRLLEGGLFPYTQALPRQLRQPLQHHRPRGHARVLPQLPRARASTTAEGKAFALEVLAHMRERLPGLPGRDRASSSTSRRRPPRST